MDHNTSYKKYRNLNSPLFLERVSAGVPFIQPEEWEGGLDLNGLLIRNPKATFFLRVDGNSMVRAGIHSGDIVVVDRSVRIRSGNVVVVELFGELMVKRFMQDFEGNTWLKPESRGYRPLRVESPEDMVYWGTVTYSIHGV